MNSGTLRRIALAAILTGAAAACACGPAPGNLEAAPAVRAQQTRVPGEYLVTLAARGEVQAIVERYGRFGIKRIQDLGRNVFLVSLTEDPGPDRMEQLRGDSAHIRAVQPNFAYGSGPARAVPHVR
jgi:hypothetical protein